MAITIYNVLFVSISLGTNQKAQNCSLMILVSYWEKFFFYLKAFMCVNIYYFQQEKSPKSKTKWSFIFSILQASHHVQLTNSITPFSIYLVSIPTPSSSWQSFSNLSGVNLLRILWKQEHLTISIKFLVNIIIIIASKWKENFAFPLELTSKPKKENTAWLWEIKCTGSGGIGPIIICFVIPHNCKE